MVDETKERIVKFYTTKSHQPTMFYPHVVDWYKNDFISKETYYQFLVSCRDDLNETIELADLIETLSN